MDPEDLISVDEINAEAAYMRSKLREVFDKAFAGMHESCKEIIPDNVVAAHVSEFIEANVGGIVDKIPDWNDAGCDPELIFAPIGKMSSARRKLRTAWMTELARREPDFEGQ